MDTEERKLSAESIETREVLERFVVENDDLLALESLIGRFNIFDALGITRVEIRHSNFLAFLLNPAESHGQGQIFLKAVLMDLLKQAPPNLRPLSPIELDGTDLRGVEVKREWKHTDLFIRCQEPPFVVVIENKIGAKEGPDQLSRYKTTIQEHYSHVPHLYVYLTATADEPSEQVWVPYSYEELYGVLKRARDANSDTIGNDVLVFLDHYLNLIGTRFMNDPELDKLCQQIYKNHRQALDLIWERVGTPTSGVLADVATVLEQDGRWEVVARRSCIDLVPKAWLAWLPPLALKGAPQSWIYVRLALRDARLDYAVEMAPMTDLPKRVEIVTKLRDEACSEVGLTRSKAREVKNTYCRISTPEYMLEWGEDNEPESDAIRVAVKERLDGLYPKLEKLALVLQPLCKVPTSAT